MPKLLKFVPKSDPLLRETMPEITDFKDPALHKTILDMCYSIWPAQLKKVKASHESASGMAANQWGLRKRIFIVTPKGSGAAEIKVMINPSYAPYFRVGEAAPKMEAALEGCFSIPLTASQVNRYTAIMATYYTPLGEKIERIMEGREARVFQHETDHLDGKLCDGRLDGYAGPECLDRIIFKDQAELKEFWETGVRPPTENKTANNSTESHKLVLEN